MVTNDDNHGCPCRLHIKYNNQSRAELTKYIPINAEHITMKYNGVIL